ncbi:MAG TPA: 4-(cytidine 5'-diphospho)-2-C-methyl-D-erythritol kinase [Hyphomicrobiaceae bacterium]|nr:4-(cytidine 5'-diphospho)-2-C-methyl-D-erythritol kinase [Hyphomicrobiaceae bacterium]
MRITETAPAKVNLTLRILGRRADGYHELASLIAFAGDVADMVTLDVAEPPAVEVTGPFAAAIEGDNLLATALARLSRLEPHLRLGRVALCKLLPVSAGLGGGSADAAALLRCVRRANPGLAHRIDWPAVAADLGADVPVCLEGRTALARGIGQCLEPVAGLPPLAVALLNPGVPLPTRAVFEVLDAGPVRREPRPTWRPPSPALLLDYLRRNGNDLEAAAIRLLPVVADVLAALRATRQCLLARMSGSGPTCFGIYPDGAAAAEAARTLAAANPAWWVRTATLG